MYPELFEIPFIHLTVKSYGLMMVIGFLAAVYLIRHLSRSITPAPQLITNAALYSLVGGVIGARLFYVIHYFDNFKDDLPSVFAVWQGGLELLGGVFLAIIVILFYLLYHRLPIRRYADILAIGLMLALVFGRIGCFLYGDCYGKPTELPWGIRFPYNSFVYISQINADLARNRSKPYLILPQEDYLDYVSTNGKWYPKHYEDLTEKQKIAVTEGKYRCLPVHPTQLYSSASAAFWCLILYLFWRRSQKAELTKNSNKLFTKPGCTFALMFIVYGITRFFIEFLRDDNPYEFNGLTISQNISIAMFVLGVILMVIFQIMNPNATELEIVVRGENNKIQSSG
ncbi:MAG: prolipoprotein diacylglyceryl transferase [Planctomycetota bacterium]|jgi:phosphatidylglycerol:prolipoprotein diacylglycerol transferase